MPILLIYEFSNQGMTGLFLFLSSANEKIRESSCLVNPLKFKNGSNAYRKIKKYNPPTG